MAEERPTSKRPAAQKKAPAAIKTSSSTSNKKPAAPKPVVFSIPKGGGIWQKIRQDNIVIFDDGLRTER